MSKTCQSLHICTYLLLDCDIAFELLVRNVEKAEIPRLHFSQSTYASPLLLGLRAKLNYLNVSLLLGQVCWETWDMNLSGEKNGRIDTCCLSIHKTLWNLDSLCVPTHQVHLDSIFAIAGRACSLLKLSDKYPKSSTHLAPDQTKSGEP